MVEMSKDFFYGHFCRLNATDTQYSRIANWMHAQMLDLMVLVLSCDFSL